MAPTNFPRAAGTGAERVRARLLTALHVGKLRPGDRVPSVRRLADITGINRKTVHRAYTQLARDGVLEVRPGSGTFVTDRRSVPADEPASSDLVGAVARSRKEATALGLSARAFARFLMACFDDGLQGVPVAITECNWEQLGIMGRDLTARLGLDPRPVTLRQLQQNPVAAVKGVRSVVTTDCHFAQVAGLVEPQGVPIYVVSLDEQFPKTMAELASRSAVLMIVRDRVFGPVFHRLLAQLGLDDDTLAQVKIVDPSRADVELRRAADETYVHVSPLVLEEMRGRVPPHLRRLRANWTVCESATERLRASLALDLALRPPGERRGAPGRAALPH